MVLASVAVLQATTSCGGGGSDFTGPPTPVVTQVALTPGTATIVAGQSASFAAQAKDAQGNIVSGLTVGWSVNDPSVATVSLGVVTAIKPGVATLTSTIGSVSTTAAITVIPAVATVTVTPTPSSLTVAQTVQLTATLRDAVGATITGRAVAWTSSSDAIATVSATGLVTAKTLGSVTVTAAVEGKSGTATVDVKPVAVDKVAVSPATATVAAGQTTLLRAVLTDGTGQPLTGRVVSWTSSDEGKATVNADGLVTGVSVGSVTITATSEEKSGTASVDIVDQAAPTLTALTVTPVSVDVRTVAQTITVSGRVSDGGGAGIRSVDVTAKGHTISTTHGDPLSVCSAPAPGGTISAGTWSCDLTIPRGAAAGQWALVSVVVTDNGSNVTTYGADQLAANFNTKFMVTSDEDVTIPSEPADIIVPRVEVDVTDAAQTIDVSVSYSDDLSGVASFVYRLTSPSNPNTFVECSGTLISGTPINGRWACSVVIPQGADPGYWSETLTAVDAASNKRSNTIGHSILVKRNP